MPHERCTPKMLLQAGDSFRFAPGTVMFGETKRVAERGIKSWLERNPGYIHESWGTVQKVWKADETVYVVLSTRTIGGGGGGHEVRAVKQGTPLERISETQVEFYQTGEFVKEVMPDVVLVAPAQNKERTVVNAGKLVNFEHHTAGKAA